jgi:hypothetical protein
MRPSIRVRDWVIGNQEKRNLRLAFPDYRLPPANCLRAGASDDENTVKLLRKIAASMNEK